jgi:hypothetical protein
MKYGDKYPRIVGLLLYFLLYGEEEEPPLDDFEVIKRFIIDMDSIVYNTLAKTITQGREILELEEFPIEWIGNTMNHVPNIPGVVMPETRYWFKWVIDTLEIEAKKAGKV